MIANHLMSKHHGLKMNPIRIAIDVMGGDFAPLNEIKGAILASKIFRDQSLTIEFVFVGKEQIIKEALKT